MSNIRETLESLNWPDGRSLSPSLKKDITSATSFLSGSVTLQQRLFCIYGDYTSTPKCPVCNSDNKHSRKHLYPDNIFGGWSLYCSKECTYASEERAKKFKDSMFAAHGVHYSGESKDLLKKSQDTLEKRTGERFALRVEGSRKKFTNTMNERYNGSYTMSPSSSLKEIVDNTNLRVYGDTVPIRTENIRKKATASIIESCGVFPPAKNKDVARKISTSLSNENAIDILEDRELALAIFEKHDKITFGVARELGVHTSTVNHYLRSHGIDPATDCISRGESELSSFIESLGVTVVKQYKIGRKVIDIFLPDFDIAVEYNGIYYHSTKFRDKGFHRDRYEMCKDVGVRIVFVWEDEWDDPIKREIVKTKLRMMTSTYNGCKIFAKNTTVAPVKFKDIAELMNHNHIQGVTHGSLYLGLYHDNTIVAAVVMKDKGDGVWELARFCTSGLVVGGFSKLVKYFKLNYEWSRIVSFADIGVSDGGLYNKNGFTLESITNPIMWYCRGNERFRRERFMKHKLKSMFPESDFSMTEREIMEHNGYGQVFDAGLMKYVMIK